MMILQCIPLAFSTLWLRATLCAQVGIERIELCLCWDAFQIPWNTPLTGALP